MDRLALENDYNGKRTIESQVRKKKHLNSYSRLFRDYDEKYLSLDLINLTLTYRKNRDSLQLTHIPLKDISKVEYRNSV